MQQIIRFLILNLFLLTSKSSMALITMTVTGNTNTVPALAASYNSMATAIAALNAVSAINGPVTFNMTSGTTETVATQLAITQPGSLLYNVAFQKNGVTANPKLTRSDAGTQTTTVLGGYGDAVIRIDGMDNLRFTGLDIVATNQGIEYGFYIHKPSAVNACKNLIIQNSVITLTKGTSAYVIGIYIDNGQSSVSSTAGLTITSTGGFCDSIQITGNTIQNVHNGIYCKLYSANQLGDGNFIIGKAGEGNIIQNFGGGASTTSNGIYCRNLSNVHIDYNTIQNTAGGGVAHINELNGIYCYGLSGTCSQSNNTITLNNTSGELAWIRNDAFGYATTTSQKINSVHTNTFGGSISNTTNSYLVYHSSEGDSITKSVRNNTISGTLNKTSTGGTLYGYYAYTNSIATEIISNNSFSNITAAGGSLVMINSDASIDVTSFIDSNQINNITLGGVSGSLTAITAFNVGSGFIRDNTISTSSAFGITAITTQVSQDSVEYDILRNKIYSLNSTSTTTTGSITGISVSSTGPVGRTNVYNNLIGLLTAPASNSTSAIIGISVFCQNVPFSYLCDVANNTVYINGTSSGTNFGSKGISHQGIVSVSADLLTLRNNIVVNESTPKGTGVATALSGGIYLSNYSPMSDKNLFYAGTPSANHLIFTNGTNSFSALSDYKSFMLNAVPGADQYSISENITFQSLTGSSPDFLKFNTALASGVESGGVPISTVNADYAGNIRYGQNGYIGTGYAPDLGAWELDGTLLNVCVGTPTVLAAQISQPIPCARTNFTVFLPYTIGAGYTYQWQISALDSVSGFANIMGAVSHSFATSDTVTKWYRCEIACLAGGLSTLSTPVKVNILPLSGTYIIDNTGAGNYTNFASAINDLDCRGANGDVVFEVTAGQIFVETTNLSIKFNGQYSVSFMKAGVGNNPVIRRSGTSSTSNFILELNGADHLTFDGIDFEQTGTASSSWVEFGISIINKEGNNGSRYNTFKNGHIVMTTGTINSKGIYIHSSSVLPFNAQGGNSYNRFINMHVEQAYAGYYFTTSTGIKVYDDSNQILGQNGQRGLISNLGNLTTSSATVYGIYASKQKNMKIDSIDISGINTIAHTSCMVIKNSDSTQLMVTNNRFTNINSTASVNGLTCDNQFRLIVSNNEVNELVSSGTGGVLGMSIEAYDSSFVFNNRIFNLIRLAATTSASVTGMYLHGYGNMLVYNNMISELHNGGSSASPLAVRGILCNYGDSSKTLKLYNNTIYLNDVGAVAGYKSAGIYTDEYNNSPVLDIRNNAVINNSDVTIGTYAIALYNSINRDVFSSSCNNNLWYAGPSDSKHLIYLSSSPSVQAQTMNAYRAASNILPAETNAVTGNVTFEATLTGTLRPDAFSPTMLESRGMPLSEIPFDFEGQPRDSLTPDIGADEGGFIFCSACDCATPVSPVNLLSNFCPFETMQLQWNEPLSGKFPTGGYDVYFGTTPNPPFVTNTSSMNYTPSTLTMNTTYYWMVVAKYASGNSTGCEIRSFSTGNSGISSVSGGQRCGPGIVNLTANGGGTINWYNSPSSNTIINTGTTYGPNLASSTNYYVSSMNGYMVTSNTVGKLTSGSASYNSSATDYLIFNALSFFILDSVTVYPSSAGNVVLNLANSSGTVLLTATKSVTVAQIGQPVMMYTGWTVSPANGYRIYKPTGSVNLYRSTSGVTYPYTLAGVVSITGSSVSSSYYSWAYKWKVRSGCESPRQLVAGIISNTTSTDTMVTACTSYTWPADGNTYTSTGIYTHTSVPASGCVQTDSLHLTIGVSGNNTPYTINACVSYTWPVNNQTYTSSGMYTASFNNVNGCDSSWQLQLNIIPCITNLELKLYLEGYYAGNSLMKSVLMNQGIGSDPTQTDFISVELHDATNYSLQAANNVMLQTNGNSATNFAVAPGLYYIAIKHRNSVETWSAVPVLFPGSPILYDFTDAMSKAYGNNMIEVEAGRWAIYTGNVNGDDNIDLLDASLFEIDVADFSYGYFSTDFNGDGNVDLLDNPVFEANINNFIFSNHP